MNEWTNDPTNKRTMKHMEKENKQKSCVHTHTHTHLTQNKTSRQTGRPSKNFLLSLQNRVYCKIIMLRRQKWRWNCSAFIRRKKKHSNIKVYFTLHYASGESMQCVNREKKIDEKKCRTFAWHDCVMFIRSHWFAQYCKCRILLGNCTYSRYIMHYIFNNNNKKNTRLAMTNLMRNYRLSLYSTVEHAVVGFYQWSYFSSVST